MRHEITREIGIDAGHRVTHHGSKCKNLHGHRYTIQATCRGPLVEAGASEGMVMDFGFLKELMMQYIDALCDHTLILWIKDPLLPHLTPGYKNTLVDIQSGVDTYGSYLITDGMCGRIYAVGFVPTAENLARHWFELLKPRVESRSQGSATLIRVRVWETPNSYADFACE